MASAASPQGLLQHSWHEAPAYLSFEGPRMLRKVMRCSMQLADMDDCMDADAAAISGLGQHSAAVHRDQHGRRRCGARAKCDDQPPVGHSASLSQYGQWHHGTLTVPCHCSYLLDLLLVLARLVEHEHMSSMPFGRPPHLSLIHI